MKIADNYFSCVGAYLFLKRSCKNKNLLLTTTMHFMEIHIRFILLMLALKLPTENRAQTSAIAKLL